MKSSYQHNFVRFLFSLFGLLSVTCFAQPTASEDIYIGLTFPFPKNKNPKEILIWTINQGYPYAQVELDTVMASDTKTLFIWAVSTGKISTLDTLIWNQPLFNKKIVLRCLNYQIGDLYSPDKIKNAENNLNQLSFLQPNSLMKTQLHSDNFGLNIVAVQRKTNSIGALVALQPNPVDGKSMLTGNFDVILLNTLKQAELIELHWKRPVPKSQSFSFKLASPYTAGLPLGFQFEFASFLRDSTFSSTDVSLRLLTKMNDMNGFSAAVNRSTNTHFNSSNLFGNTTHKTYSLRYSKNLLRVNVLNFLLEGQAGTRTVQSETRTTNKKIYATRARTYGRFMLSNRFFSDLNLEVNALFSDSLFNNEIPRLGGTKNLRGFIEESIYASQYAMLNFEVGANLGSEVQCFAFTDFANVYLPTKKKYYDTGVGLRFQQETGFVGITYGIGNVEDRGLQLRNARIGITFSSRF